MLIPLSYNDGTPVPWRTIESIQAERYLAFQGWTIEGIVKGAYRMQTGDRKVEDLVKVSVVLDERQVPDLEKMVARWCRTLGQETMLLKVTDFVVKFVHPHAEADQT